MHLRRDQRGASLVEFALVLPLFLLVVGAILSLLWLLTARSAITGAARDAARYASIRHDPLTCEPDPCGNDWPTETEVATYANQRAGRWSDGIHVTVIRATEPNAPVSVTIEKDLPVLFKAMGNVFGADSLHYTSTGKARSE